MVQYLVVGLIVLVALLQLVRKYLPAGARRRLVYLARGRKGDSALARWLDKDDSCGSGCDTCKACETEPPPPAEGKHRVIRMRVER
jgi:hypothetical protein